MTAPVLTGDPFKVVSEFQPAGDQPKAIRQLTEGIVRGDRLSFLLPGESGDRSFFAQVVGDVMSGPVSDGVRGVRFRADRVTK